MLNENKGIIAIAIGALLLLVNVGIAVTGAVDGLIEGSVADTVASSYDGLDDDGNEDYTADFGDDWINVSSEKTYFANSISNLEEILADDSVDPTYEKVGPFIYYENTTREILDFDYDEGSITYSGYETFEWCADCTWTDDGGVSHSSVSGDTVVNQINILWNTQRIAGMGSGIEYGEIFAKAMFASKMIEFDLSNRAPSIWASEDIQAMAVAAGGGPPSFGQAASNYSAESQVLMGSYQASLNQSGLDGSMVSGDFEASVIESIFYTAEDGHGNGISMTDPIGPALIAGMGAPNETVTAARSALYGYSGDLAAHMDWAIYSLAASKFVENGGGAEINNQTPQLLERFREVSGVNTMTNPQVLENLLFNETVGMLTSYEIGGIPLPGMVVGFLLPLQDGDYGGAQETYGIGLFTIIQLGDYIVPWVGLDLEGFTPATEFELILTGNQGTMNSNDWWLTSFGDYDPLGGVYIPIGLNRGNFAGMASLTQEQSDFILNDPDIGLKSSFPGPFMYGELSGMSLPDSNGVQHVWDDSYVASLYGISEEAAGALRDWVSNFYFDTVMPVLLNFVTGNTPYYSMPISNWLYGWDDAVSSYFGFFSWNSLETNDTYYGSAHWVDDNPLVNSDGLGTSTDDNDTWVPDISTGDRSVYKMSTRGDSIGQRMAQGYINSDGNGLCDFDYDSNGDFLGYDLECEAGQVYGMTEYLTWRAPHREEGASGLLTGHVGNNDTTLMGTAGSLATPNDPFSLNVAGYAVTTTEVGSKTTYKGIEMVEHTVNVMPADTQIQGKLIGSSTYVDVIPGALPVYLEANIDLKVEPVTTAIMYGKAKVTFHLDTRGPGSVNPDLSAGSTDSMPVFEIHTFSEIDDNSAKNFTGAVSDNLGPMGWTNFGGDAGAPLSYVHYGIAAFYVLSVVSLAYGIADPNARAILSSLGASNKDHEEE
jgi:hypothetical protein